MSNGTRIEGDELLKQARHCLASFVEPLLAQLAPRVDPRLMRSFREAFGAILTGHDARSSLLLTSFADAAPVTSRRLIHTVKRFHRFLRNDGWSDDDLKEYVLQRSLSGEGSNKDELLVVDLSGCEKKYAKKMEQLCNIRDTDGGLGERKVTQGYPFLMAVRTSLAKGPAKLVSWQLFSYTAPDFLSQNLVEWQFIQSLWQRFGQRVVFTMDRGFGRFTLLGDMACLGMRFVVRLKGDSKVDSGDDRLISLKWLAYAMALVHCKRVYCTVEGRYKIARYGWRKVKRPEVKGDLYLVIEWLEEEKEPWILLTNELVQSAEDAWRIIRIYWRRMEVEQTLRYLMSELGIESFRVRSIEAIKKLFALAMTVLACLVELFEAEPELVEALCRLGRWLGLKGEKPTLYKLRWGLRRLLLSALPQPPGSYG